jgi:hypothetical protein
LIALTTPRGVALLGKTGIELAAPPAMERERLNKLPALRVSDEESKPPLKVRCGFATLSTCTSYDAFEAKVPGVTVNAFGSEFATVIELKSLLTFIAPNEFFNWLITNEIAEYPEIRDSFLVIFALIEFS